VPSHDTIFTGAYAIRAVVRSELHPGNGIFASARVPLHIDTILSVSGASPCRSEYVSGTWVICHASAVYNRVCQDLNLIGSWYWRLCARHSNISLALLVCSHPHRTPCLC